MSYPYYDITTYYIYFYFGCLCVLSMHLARGGRFSKSNELKGFLILYISLLFFAICRKVEFALGGADTLGYQERFINYFNHGAERYEKTDVLFGQWMRIIRTLTDNPYIYRGFCYGLIVMGYIVFIKFLCPQKISPIPFICILVPFMRSLNTMRSSMSIALILFSLVCLYKREYIWCAIWALGAVLMHRLSFAMLAVFPFVFIARKYLINISKLRFILLTCTLILISYLLSTVLQKYIIIFQLFANDGSSDYWYLTNGQGNNIILNWPIYLPHLLLYIAYIVQYHRIKNNNNHQIRFVLTLFYFDIIILPATLVLGMWRFQEYLYIPNLILWAYIIPIFYSKVKNDSRFALRLIFFAGFTGLMLIRLSREWMDACLMPYLFFWQ